MSSIVARLTHSSKLFHTPKFHHVFQVSNKKYPAITITIFHHTKLFIWRRSCTRKFIFQLAVFKHKTSIILFWQEDRARWQKSRECLVACGDQCCTVQISVGSVWLPVVSSITLSRFLLALSSIMLSWWDCLFRGCPCSKSKLFQRQYSWLIEALSHGVVSEGHLHSKAEKFLEMICMLRLKL